MKMFVQKMWQLTIKYRSLLGLLASVVVAAAAYLVFVRPVLLPVTVVAAVDLIVFFAVLITFAVMLAMLGVVLVLTIVRILFMRHNERNRIWYKRLHSRAVWSGALGVVLVLMILLSQWLAFTPLIKDASGKVISGSIASLEQVDRKGATRKS